MSRERERPAELGELTARWYAAERPADPEQLADALWLARFLGEPSNVPAPQPPSPPLAPPRSQPEPAPAVAQPRTSHSLYPRAQPDSVEPPQHRERDPSLPGQEPGQEGAPSARQADAATTRVRAPGVSALSGLLEHQRALRPLARYPAPVRPPRAGVAQLDEEGSATASARAGVLRPLFDEVGRRGAEIQLVLDASPTASIWQLAFEQLRQACAQSGSFRDVRVRYLHRRQDGSPALSSTLRPGPRELHPPEEYTDLSGRCFTLVLSDCAGRLWWEGAAPRMLHSWCRGPAPVALVQPLPPRLWSRTALPPQPGRLRRRMDSGRVDFSADRRGRPAPGAEVVPVLAPTAAALANYSRTMSGSCPPAVRGAAALVLPDHPAVRRAGTARRSRRERDPRQLLDAFLATASPGAVELALHLSAVPLLLPVIELVQRAMLPRTGPAELAEVLLGGVLERLPDSGGGGPRYRFAPGVADLLGAALGRDTSILVLEHVSEYVERHFGRGSRNFAALAVASLRGQSVSDAGARSADRVVPGGEELFATVPQEVVKRFGKTESDDAAASPGSGATEVASLRQAEEALAARRDFHEPEFWRELRRIDELARSILDAPEPRPGEHARARLLLARSLVERARAQQRHRPDADVKDLFDEALTLLRGDDAATVLERAATHHLRWRVEGERRHLLQARGELVAHLAELAPPDATTARYRLAQVLLDLARTEPDTAARRDLAAHAVPLLEALLEGPSTDDEAGTPPDAPGRLDAALLLDRAVALWWSEASPPRLLAALAAVREAAEGDPEMLRTAALVEARTHRGEGDVDAAEQWYGQAVGSAEPYSDERCELLAEWAELRRASADPSGAEGLLREALPTAPSDTASTAYVHHLLAEVLWERWSADGFLPVLYEAAHLAESAVRGAPEPLDEAAYCRLLGEVRLALAGGEASQAAEEAFARGLAAVAAVERAAARAVLGPAGAAPAARAQRRARTPEAIAAELHLARARLHEQEGRRRAALGDYRAAARRLGTLARRPSATAGSEPLATQQEFVARRVRELRAELRDPSAGDDAWDAPE